MRVSVAWFGVGIARSAKIYHPATKPVRHIEEIAR